jgi:L-ribulose-5-phosphate 3-epimerase
MASRRAFLTCLSAGMVTAGLPGSAVSARVASSRSAEQQPGAGIKKSTLMSMLPKERSIEIQAVSKDEEAAEIREASQKTGLRVHSVMNADHWRFPLSSSDPEAVNRSVRGMETSIKNATLWGCDTVLLVPAVVDANTPYREAWTRSQRVIRERLLPVARDAKIVIAIEEVWNKFLLSPLEFARYVDELESPWAKAYFDVGNVVIYAYPQDWIRTLGQRIVKVHLKDFNFDRQNGRFTWKNLGEGDIDWPEVRRAFQEIGYTGYVTTELAAGDAAYLKDVSGRVERFLAGLKPVG